MYYERDVYNCFDLIGDLGGVYNVIWGFLGIICIPYSQFSYNLKISKLLFTARTHDKKMFLKDSKKQDTKSETRKSHMTEKMRSELQKHYVIAIRFKDSILLFFS